MRRKIIIGNWKMNKNRKEMIDYLITLNQMINKNQLLTDELDFALAPGYLGLIASKSYILRKNSIFSRNSLKKLIIAAQDVNSEISGSYTGSVSYSQIKDEGINYSIVGHYETRKNSNLTEEDVNKKVLALTNNGMYAILCVGDSKEAKEENRSIEFITNQIETDLNGVLIDNLDHLIIAYEPIYAINTANPVSVSDAEEVIKAIRSKISTLYSEDVANSIRIIYGGSINSANYNDYVSSDEIDGLLIGKSSLDVTTFYDIVYGTSQVITKKYPALGNKYFILKQKELANSMNPLPEVKAKKDNTIDDKQIESKENLEATKSAIESIQNTKEKAIETENKDNDETAVSPQ